MFSDPLKNLKAFDLREGDVVADLGAGTGYYSMAAGTLVPSGKVYAIEIVKDFLETIKKRVAEAHLKNVEILWGDIEKIGGTKIGDNVIDKVIVSNVLFQIANKTNFVLEIKRILKQKGGVLLIDWSETSILQTTAVVPKDKARLMFEKEGFVFEREINAGTDHYGMIMVKE